MAKIVEYKLCGPIVNTSNSRHCGPLGRVRNCLILVAIVNHKDHRFKLQVSILKLKCKYFKKSSQDSLAQELII